MKNPFTSGVVSDVLFAGEIAAFFGTVVFGIVAALGIIAGIGLLVVFFWLLGYVWMPSLFVIGLWNVQYARRRWVVAGCYAALTGLIVWAYDWPLPLIILAVLAQAGAWIALSIPMMRFKSHAEDRRQRRIARNKQRIAKKRQRPTVQPETQAVSPAKPINWAAVDPKTVDDWGTPT